MPEPHRTAIVNIGTLVTGDLETPTAAADRLGITDGVITDIGSAADPGDADRVIDVHGATVGPGLIDSHCHVVLGDFTPRQNTVGFLSSYVHGGICQAISPGEIHAPGRPHDAEGVMALAIFAQRAWANYRPNGMKVHGGAVVIEPTLQPEHFRHMAGQGVWLAKFGFGLYEDPADGLPQVRAAQEVGIKVMCHSGGASIPGSKPITADHLMLLKPDVCGHINGGPTSLDDDKLTRIITETDLVLQIVQAGNIRSAIHIVDTALSHGAAGRIIIGSDTPTGTGVIPLGVIKTMAELSSLTDADPATVWAWASGVTADIYGLESGKVEAGRPADLVVADAPWGSHGGDALGSLARGDIPGISAVLIDGKVRALRSRNTPAAAHQVTITPEIDEPPGSAHV
ncbi:MAG: amidohydrolase family protein [Acidimicrobiia bacterium]